VLDPAGKPVAAAKLFTEKLLSDQPTSVKDVAAEVVGQTGADGTFRVAVRPLPGQFPRRHLIAYVPGFGVDWVSLEELPRGGDVTLRLVTDVPITGRLVTTEGRPLAGASVSAVSVYVPADEKLDAYLAGWKSNWRDIVASPRKRLYVPLDLLTGA